MDGWMDGCQPVTDWCSRVAMLSMCQAEADAVMDDESSKQTIETVVGKQYFASYNRSSLGIIISQCIFLFPAEAVLWIPVMKELCLWSFSV